MQDSEDKPSKSELKRTMLERQRLGEALIGLSGAELDEFALPARLREAIEAAQKMRKHGALYRQRQYIGRLMREADAAAIGETLQRIRAHDRAYAARHAAAERWRTRLLEHGDEALEGFLQTCPTADRQHLRQLIREARRAAEREQPPAASRRLFRYLRDEIDAAERAGG